MTESYDEQIERRKILRGMKQLNKKCHCGKLKVNHTIQEAKQCTGDAKTKTIVTRITNPDDVEPMKI